ncbi:DUF736 domain-containing protein [Lichenifustis flavocetrariae]|uniref:DUF736 domain-containing protein n=1 Tax=Lichenifustis flavocetrariae TaxID=2949735 RepID=A0AA41Z3A1_9HYPH|nr:DUF736 domain-containing protein [Lichenifustis flavocetrariae]MCW6512088.1 DUF736 domain-containing protein [Lichenifustis flavocetrariae]
MSVIGTFKSNGNDFTGEIATLTIRARDVRIVPAKRTAENGPSHQVYAGQAEIGAAWSKRSKEGRNYLSVLLDDPSMMAPFYASLVSNDEDKDHSLLWSRGTRRDRD